MNKLLESVETSLASRSSRRGFLGWIARATLVMASSALGLVGLQQRAVAYDVVCCTLATATHCSTCPNCPPSYDYTYWWTCCYGGCVYYCRDCENTSLGTWCSCYWTENANCTGQICSFRPAP